jgi:hypothetical protein
MAEAAQRVGDADLALQLLEEEARCRRELFDTSLAAAKEDVTEFIAAAYKRITSAAAGDLQRLIESELAARAAVWGRRWSRRRGCSCSTWPQR